MRPAKNYQRRENIIEIMNKLKTVCSNYIFACIKLVHDSVGSIDFQKKLLTH